MSFMNGVIKQNEIVGSDTKHLEKIIDTVFSTDKIEVKTRLNQAQVNAITKGLAFAERYGVNLLEKLCFKHMELLVSLDGQGRKEFTTITSAMSATQGEQQPNLFEKLVNGKS